MSERLGGFASYDGLPPRPGSVLEAGPGAVGNRGGRGRRDSVTADSMASGTSPNAPPPGAREDPRAAAGRKVSYYDIDRTAEGDVELTY